MLKPTVELVGGGERLIVMTGRVVEIARTKRGLRVLCGALAPMALASLSACESGNRLTAGAGPDSEQLVACGVAGLGFPRAALDTLSDAPAPDREMAEAMESFLGSGEGDFWPQEEWRVLSSTDGMAIVFTADESQLWFQTLELEAGDWRWAGSSTSEECPLHIPPPDGFNAVTWRLDPDAAAPTSTSSEIEVLVTETACASGEPVGDRLVGPEVEITDTEVRVGFVAEAQEGFFNCQGNPETPIGIQLEEPLGDRDLVDAHDLGKDLRGYL